MTDKITFFEETWDTYLNYYEMVKNGSDFTITTKYVLKESGTTLGGETFTVTKDDLQSATYFKELDDPVITMFFDGKDCGYAFYAKDFEDISGLDIRTLNLQ